MASDRLQSSLVEIERDWTLADVENAHLTLDIIEDANTR